MSAEPNWKRYTVLVEMKDGSIKHERVEVNGNDPRECRVYPSEDIRKEDIRAIVGNFRGWTEDRQ